MIDDALKTEWTIHPWSWLIKDDAKHIKLDREHTEYKFIKPDELKSYDHVPQLELGLGRVIDSRNGERKDAK